MDGTEDLVVMFRNICIFLVLSIQISGCANTQSGKGFDLVRDEKYSEALPYFEAAAEQDGSKSSAVMASFIYLSGIFPGIRFISKSLCFRKRRR